MQMEDIYEGEQAILDEARSRIDLVRGGSDFDFEEYVTLVKEYDSILRQLRRVTRLADRTANELHGDNLELTDKVHFDALTGIYSRRFMEDNLRRIKKSHSRSGGILSVIMIDVDFFKKYNDTYGHAAGDMCLKAIAETISGSLSRPDDFTARYGGEEFIVVLSNTDEVGARFIAEKILENVQALNIPHAKSEVAERVTVSIGVTTGTVERAQYFEDYIKRADEALYISKQDGRNRITYLNFEIGAEKRRVLKAMQSER